MNTYDPNNNSTQQNPHTNPAPGPAYPQNAITGQGQGEDSIDIKRFIFKLLVNWYWFIISAALALTIAWLINRYTEPLYQVQTTLMISRNSQTMTGVESLIEELGLFRRRRQTDIINEIEVLKSYQLTYTTLKELPDFDVTYVAKGDIKNTPLYKNSPFVVEVDSNQSTRKGYPVNITILNDREYKVKLEDGYEYEKRMRFGEPFHYRDHHFTLRFRSEGQKSNFASGKNQSHFFFIINDLYGLTNRYRNKLNISLSNERGRTVVISTKGRNVTQQVDFLNHLCNVYIRMELEEKNRIAENAISFIESQMYQMADSLAIQEEALEDFRKRNNVVDISEQGQKLFSEYKTYQEEQVGILVRINYLEYLLNQLDNDSLLYREALPVIPDLSSEVISKQVSTMNDIILDYKVKSYTITDQHPDYYISNIEVETQVASLQALINNYLSYSREQLKKTNERMAEVQQRLNQIPSKERALLNIQRKYTLNDQLYTFLLEKRAEAGIAKASNVAGNQVLDEARSQGAILISPKSRNNNMTALMIGLMIPLGIIFLIDFFNNKIISRSDVEANTNLPIIGDISHNGRSSNIPIIDHPKSVIAETIRGLRTNLQYLLRGQDKKVILLTSNIGGEGKTFCSLNLSASLAISGKKTLVVGLDLRKPRLNNYFGISNETGLTNYLIEKLEIEETIQQTHIDNLYIASSGPIPPNPAELIETSRMDDFMNYARKHFDYIVIDTPPAAIVADAINLGRYADVAIFVVRQRYSRKESLKYINEIAGSHKMDHVNLVVNDIEKPKGYAYGYGYGYGYGYSYGYGYGYGGYHGYYDEEDTMRVSLMDKFVRWVKRR